MSDSIDKLAQGLYKALKDSEKREPKPYDTTGEVVKVEYNKAWVKFAGSDSITPVNRTVDAKEGDIVLVRVSGRQAWISGNSTSPPTDNTVAYAANSAAEFAVNTASTAALFAERAELEAAVAHTSANSAAIEANKAARSAETAQALAQTIDETTYGTILYQYTHMVEGESVTEVVYKREDGTYYYISDDEEITVNAEDLDSEDGEYITIRAEDGLDHTVEVAQNMANSAADSAKDAADSAQSASESAYQAIYHLSEVEKVVDVLAWISKHGKYSETVTEDTTVQAGKWYFERSGEGTAQSPYTYEVGTPTSNPHDEGFYELESVDEAVSNYVSTHLALMDDGLWVQGDEDIDSRIQINEDGIYLHKGSKIVAEYTDDIVLGDKKDVHIKLSANGGLEFYQGQENRVAYINQNRLYIESAELKNELRIGKFVWIVRGENRISLRYEPI